MNQVKEKVKRKGNITTVKRLIKHIEAKRRIDLAGLLIVIIICGFAEMFSIATVIPFLTVILDPQKIWDFDLIRNNAYLLNIKEPNT